MQITAALTEERVKKPVPPNADVSNIAERCYSCSMLKSFNRCPQIGLRTYIQNLKPKGDSIKMLFGTVIHEALACMAKGGMFADAIDICQLYLPTTHPLPMFTISGAEGILTKYVKQWKSSPYKVRDVEVEFHVDMGEGRFFSGRIDQIVEHNDRIYVLDHKTTASVGANFMSSYDPPELQMDGYCYACGVLVGKCDGAIIDGISTAANPKQRFLRITPRRCTDLFPTVFTQSARHIEKCVLEGVFEQRTNACHYYGGCAFQDLCVYGDNPSIVEMKYEQRT